MRLLLALLLACAPAWAQQVITTPAGAPILAGGAPILSAGSGGGGGSGTTALALVDFEAFVGSYDPPTFHVVQRKAGQTYADVVIPFTYSGSAPSAPECQVVNTKTSAVVRSYVTLTGWTAAGGVAQGTIPNVPQGSPYRADCGDSVTHARSGALFSQTAGKWGIGPTALINCQSQCAHLFGISIAANVPGTSLTESGYWAAGNIPAAQYDEYGWHPPCNSGPLCGQGSSQGQDQTVTRYDGFYQFLRLVTQAMHDAFGADVPLGVTAEWHNGSSILPFTAPSGAWYTHLAQSGTDPTPAVGSVGLLSPPPIRQGGFEVLAIDQGAGDQGAGTTAYRGYLANWAAGWEAVAGRTGAALKTIITVVGGEDTNGQGQSLIEQMRAAQLLYVSTDAPAAGRTATSLWVETDLPNDGSHITDTTVGNTGGKRMAQAVIYAVGAAPYGSGGPRPGTPTRSGNVVTFPVVMDGGTALQPKTTGCTISGWLANTAADFSGTNIAVTAAISGTNVVLTLPASGVSYPIYVKHLGGRIGYLNPGSTTYSSGAPDISCLVYDNARYPYWTNKVGTGSEEPLGFPLQPTPGAMAVN